MMSSPSASVDHKLSPSTTTQFVCDFIPTQPELSTKKLTHLEKRMFLGLSSVDIRGLQDLNTRVHPK